MGLIADAAIEPLRQITPTLMPATIDYAITLMNIAATLMIHGYY